MAAVARKYRVDADGTFCTMEKGSMIMNIVMEYCDGGDLSQVIRQQQSEKKYII